MNSFGLSPQLREKIEAYGKMYRYNPLTYAHMTSKPQSIPNKRLTYLPIQDKHGRVFLVKYFSPRSISLRKIALHEAIAGYIAYTMNIPANRVIPQQSNGYGSYGSLHNYIPDSQTLENTRIPTKYIENSELFYTGNKVLDTQLAQIEAFNHFIANSDFCTRQILYKAQNPESPEIYSIDHEDSFDMREIDAYKLPRVYPGSQQEQKFISIYTETLDKLIAQWPPEKIMHLHDVYDEYQNARRKDAINPVLLSGMNSFFIEKAYARAVKTAQHYNKVLTRYHKDAQEKMEYTNMGLSSKIDLFYLLC